MKSLKQKKLIAEEEKELDIPEKYRPIDTDDTVSFVLDTSVLSTLSIALNARLDELCRDLESIIDLQESIDIQNIIKELDSVYRWIDAVYQDETKLTTAIVNVSALKKKTLYYEVKNHCKLAIFAMSLEG